MPPGHSRARTVAEAADHLIGIQPQRIGVVAHKAPGIGRAGQVAHAAFFEGDEIDAADAQRLAHILNGET